MKSKIGEKISRLRKKRKMTLQNLADLTGASKSYIWELENKSAVRPSAEKICSIAAALGVTAEFLINDSCEEPGNSVIDQAVWTIYKNLSSERKILARKIISTLSEKIPED